MIKIFISTMLIGQFVCEFNLGGASEGLSRSYYSALQHRQDGTYKIGIRPHNITTYKEGNNSVEIKGKVQISELSGSESLIHFTNGNLNWVSLSNGIQQKNVGDDTKLYMNTDEFLFFDQNNRLVKNG